MKKKTKQNKLKQNWKCWVSKFLRSLQRSPMRSYKQKFENHKGQEKPAYPVTTLKIGDTVREHYTAKHF